MIAGLGYGIRAPDNWNPTTPTVWTGTFEGKPNSGDIGFSLSNISAGRFNLIGNPYPSSLDLVALYDENSTKIENKFYVYEHTQNPSTNDETKVNYGIITLNPRLYVPATNSPYIDNEATFEDNPQIRIGQGFFCKAVTGANGSGTLNITNNMRSSNVAAPFFRIQNTTSANDYDMFRVKITSPSNTQNQMIVGFFEGAQNSLDNIDSNALGNPTIYSKIDDQKLIIQANALPFESSTQISLGFKADLSGEYIINTFDARGIFENNPMILLHDLLLNQYHNLSLEPYTFETNIGTFDNRFKIIFSGLLDNPNFDTKENSFIAYQNNNLLHISLKNEYNEPLTNVSIFDLNGSIIYTNTEINSNTVSISNTALAQNTILIVKATSLSGATHTAKVILNSSS
jgi:hypothetical protein